MFAHFQNDWLNEGVEFQGKAAHVPLHLYLASNMAD